MTEVEVLESLSGTWWGAADEILHKIREERVFVDDIISIDCHNDGPEDQAQFAAIIKKKERSCEELLQFSVHYYELNTTEIYIKQYQRIKGLIRVILLVKGRIISVTSAANEHKKRVTFLFYALPQRAAIPIVHHSPDRPLRVMSFNIWYDGGKSLFNTATVIQMVQADIISLQEATAHSCELIAHILGFHYHRERHVISRFKIVPEWAKSKYEVVLDLGQRRVSVFNVHADSYPYPPYELHRDGVSVQDAVEAEANTQLASILHALKPLAERIKDNDSLILLTGDFNSASFLDYAPHSSTSVGIVPWPTSKYCSDIGMLDTYYYAQNHDRAVGNRFDDSTKLENSSTEPLDGRTWCTVPEQEVYGIHDRIDFIYVNRSANVQVVNSFTVDSNNTIADYPSDHRGVVSDLVFSEIS